MTGRDDRTDEMIALEQARAQLEIGLSGDARWLALRHGASSGRDDGTNAERAAQLESTSGNPLYQSWKLVTEAMILLRAKQRAQEAPDVASEPTWVQATISRAFAASASTWPAAWLC